MERCPALCFPVVAFPFLICMEMDVSPFFFCDAILIQFYLLLCHTFLFQPIGVYFKSHITPCIQLCHDLLSVPSVWSEECSYEHCCYRYLDTCYFKDIYYLDLSQRSCTMQCWKSLGNFPLEGQSVANVLTRIS